MMWRTDPPASTMDEDKEPPIYSRSAIGTPMDESYKADDTEATSPPRPEKRKRGQGSGEKDRHLTTRRIKRDNEESTPITVQALTSLSSALGDEIKKGMIAAAKIAADAAREVTPSMVLTAGTTAFQAIMSGGTTSEAAAQGSALEFVKQLLNTAHSHSASPTSHVIIRVTSWLTQQMPLKYNC
jgi:hypothetical protein